MAIKTWVGTTANWNVASNWSPAAVPTATDDLVFNNSADCNVNANYQFNSIDFNGYTGILSGTASMSIAGSNTGTTTGVSLRFSTGMTQSWTGGVTFTSGVGGYITLNGKSFGGTVTFNNGAGVWQVLDAMNVAANFNITAVNALILNANVTIGNTLTLTAGTLAVLNCANITAAGISSNNSNIRTLSMGCGTWTLSSTIPWNFTTITNLTFNPEQSRILITNPSSSNISFNSGGLSYYTLEIARGAGTGFTIISGNNTFVNFIDNTSTAGHTIQFTGFSTNNFYRFIVKGTAGNPVSIQRGALGAYFVNKLGREVVFGCDYITFGGSFTASNTTGTWYIGPNSTNTSFGPILGNPPSVQSLLGCGGVG